jgi:signal peptidase II
VAKITARVRDYLFLIGISGLIVVLDQWTKYLVQTSLEVGESWIPIAGLEQYLRIVHWHNTGAAFGILPQASMIFTIVAIIVAIAIIFYWPQVPAKHWALRLALAMQLGGALGNLTSRLIYGVVTDFIAVGNFPVFNVADSSISVGVAILIIATWIEERRARRSAEMPVEADDHEATTSEVDTTV